MLEYKDFPPKLDIRRQKPNSTDSLAPPPPLREHLSFRVAGAQEGINSSQQIFTGDLPFLAVHAKQKEEGS